MTNLITLNTIKDQFSQQVMSPSIQWIGRTIQEINASFSFSKKDLQSIVGLALRVQVITVPILTVAVVLCAVALRGALGSSLRLHAYNDVGSKFDGVLKNLKDLRGETGKQFLAAVEQFQARYEPWKDDPSYAALFADVKYQRECFEKLLELKQTVFLPTVHINDRGIIPVVADGNCLFRTVGQGLRLLEEEPSQFNALDGQSLDHESLRARSIQWEREHLQRDPQLREYIDQAIESFIAVKEPQYACERATLEGLSAAGETVDGALTALKQAEDELQVLQNSNPSVRYEAYLTQVEKNGFYASVAEIYALSQLYPQVAFHTHREVNGWHIEGFDPSFNEAAELTVTILNIDSKHFDLYVPRKT